MLTTPGRDRSLGVVIVGEHAGDLLAEFVSASAMASDWTRSSAAYIYTTMTEANKYAAGAWKKAHAPAALLKWAERYHAWQHG